MQRLRQRADFLAAASAIKARATGWWWPPPNQRQASPTPRKEKKSRRKHIDYDNYDTYRHSIALVPGTPLHSWYGRTELPVTSYHHQGIRDLAPRFTPMAHADDGLIEGFYDSKSDFVVGLQFHPERMPEESEGNFHIWKAFGAAVARRKA